MNKEIDNIIQLMHNLHAYDNIGVFGAHCYFARDKVVSTMAIQMTPECFKKFFGQDENIVSKHLDSTITNGDREYIEHSVKIDGVTFFTLEFVKKGVINE